MGKAEQINALEHGKGIQYLLDCAYEILHNPLYVIDLEYNLLGFTDVPVDDPIWNELTTRGTYSQNTLEFLAREHIIEDVTNTDRIVLVSRHAVKYKRLADFIFNRMSNTVGLVTMYDSQTPFDEEDKDAIKKLADKITYEIRNHEYFITLTMNFYEENINLLLNGTIINPFLYNARVQILYNDFDAYLYLAVLDIEQNDRQEEVRQSRLSYLKSMLITKYPLFKFSIFDDHIVMLMSSTSQSLYSAPFLSTYADLLERNGFSMGISNSFENMYELRTYYDQALAALMNGYAAKEGQRLFIHRDSP